MNRTHLERAVGMLATTRGYTFSVVPDSRLAQAVTLYPAAVLTPIVLRSAEGCRHGRQTYDITLRLLRPGAKLAPEECNIALAELEEDLLTLFTDLSEDPIVLAVEKLKIQPAAATLTSHGELSQTATAGVITWF